MLNGSSHARSGMKGFPLSLLLAAVFWTGSCRNSSPEEGERVEAVPAAGISLPAGSFRLTFGLKDTVQQSWNGHLVPSEGQRLQVQAGRFRAHNYGLSQDPKFPNDFVRDTLSWICSTRQVWMRYSKEFRLQSPTLLLHVWENPGRDPIRVKTKQGDFSLYPDRLQPFEPELFLEGTVRVERVPPAARIASERKAQQDFPSLLSSASGSLWVAWQEYRDDADAVCVRKRVGDTWGPVFVLIRGADVLETAVGEDAVGRIWVIWSMQVDGNWDLYGRFLEESGWSSVKRLTEDPSPDAYHRVVSDSGGYLWVFWQRTVGDYSQIFTKSFDGQQWSEETLVSQGESASGNNWLPAAAAGSDGSIAVAWDGYASGNYDVYLRRFRNGAWGKVQAVTDSERFEAHPAVAVDEKNRVWLAWEESGPEWGKDTGKLAISQGVGLHQGRSIRVVCLEGDKMRAPAGLLSDVLPGNWDLPHLAIDSDGSPWLFLRRMSSRRPDSPGTVYWPRWDIFCTRYNGSQWGELMSVPHSSGRKNMRPSSTLDSEGRLWAVWPTDNRSTKFHLQQHGQILVGRFDSPSLSSALELKAYESEPSPQFDRIHPDEAKEVERIRSYRIQLGGKSYSIYRGDMHRHTDLSMDGGRDGSLLDTYRYALDAARLDFLGITDHNDDVEEPYSWWLSQKVADCFQLENFVAFYAYERSLAYPNGHRNIFFTRRGIRILPILAWGEGEGWEGSERLFWYLRRNDGTSIPHTTATGSGTDWRDSDPKVEHLVEIFQGMRDTYEYPGAPSPKTLKPSPTLAQDDSPPRRFGSIWNALAKGLRLGFVASSDHHSTHISYACLIAEKLSLDGLLEAIRARRAYAATDNIILDVRYFGSNGEHLMGEQFASEVPVRIKARIVGTDRIDRVDLIRNNEIIYTISPNRPETAFDFAETDALPGESYYYVRVMQEDGEMAWGSPAWVTYGE